MAGRNRDADSSIYSKRGRCAASWTAEGVTAGRRAMGAWLMIEPGMLAAGRSAEWKQLVPKSAALIDWWGFTGNVHNEQIKKYGSKSFVFIEVDGGKH